ncbi:MAG: hypothetical protein OEZ47_11385, partial [Gammaproteobacteria bacterium]|nr:hypothetical protein [Gammaproteobacteria bacterium]
VIVCITPCGSQLQAGTRRVFSYARWISGAKRTSGQSMNYLHPSSYQNRKQVIEPTTMEI